MIYKPQILIKNVNFKLKKDMPLFATLGEAALQALIGSITREDLIAFYNWCVAQGVFTGIKQAAVATGNFLIEPTTIIVGGTVITLLGIQAFVMWRFGYEFTQEGVGQLYRDGFKNIWRAIKWFGRKILELFKKIFRLGGSGNSGGGSSGGGNSSDDNFRRVVDEERNDAPSVLVG